MSRIIAIGDIHGCADALRALLDEIALQADDTLITLGDCVDRGPDSKGVIDQLLAVAATCRHVPLMGNHELMMLGAIDQQSTNNSWSVFGGQQTLASYGNSLESIPAEHVTFIRGFQRTYEADDHIFVHANYIADLDMADQPERTIFWERITSTCPPPHKSGKRVIVGHTPQIDGNVLDLGHLVCIDTCCFAGGWLTAMDVTTNQYWQADVIGSLRTT